MLKENKEVRRAKVHKSTAIMRKVNRKLHISKSQNFFIMKKKGSKMKLIFSNKN